MGIRLGNVVGGVRREYVELLVEIDVEVGEKECGNCDRVLWAQFDPPRCELFGVAIEEVGGVEESRNSRTTVRCQPCLDAEVLAATRTAPAKEE